MSDRAYSLLKSRNLYNLCLTNVKSRMQYQFNNNHTFVYIEDVSKLLKYFILFDEIKNNSKYLI